MAKKGRGSRTAGPRKKSRVAEFAHLLGVETDSQVAARAGVTSEAVRAYRHKQGITGARDRGGRSGAVASSSPRNGASSQTPAATAGAKPRRAGKRSPLDAFADQLGKVPDREIAAKAGVSVSAVSQYRRYRKIPAISGEAGDARRPRRRAQAQTLPVSVGVDAPVRSVVSPRRSFMVLVQSGGAEKAFVVLGDDIAAASTTAVEHAGRFGGEVLRIEAHLDVLG